MIGFVISVLIISVLSLIIWRLTIRLRLYEDYITTAVNGVRTAYASMKSIDDRNIFESDDEVGGVFGELADVIYYLKDVIDFVEGEPIIQPEEEIEPTQEQ